MTKPFSQACENNKAPILAVLETQFQHSKHVLEIGSGTGQHAVYFARHLPHLIWQTSDLRDNHDGILQWINETALPNLKPPFELDVQQPQWLSEHFDAVFSANTAHIMSWSMVEAMFEGIGKHLQSGGVFCLYGPFNQGGEFSSDSNRAFDAYLKSRCEHMGIRDLEVIADLAKRVGLETEKVVTMPANNHIICCKKRHCE